jgi:hypothetical protein
VAARQNQPGYDQGKAPRDQWHFITVGVEKIVHFLTQSRCYEKKCRSDEWTYNIGSLEALFQALQHSQVHPSHRTPQGLTSFQQALGFLWCGSRRASMIENYNLVGVAHG